MNKEIIKAIHKQEKNYPIKEWWHENGYKILRVVLFPLWVVDTVYRKTIKKLNNKQIWNKTRADKILSYYIPRKSVWDAKNQVFSFFDNGMGWLYSYNIKKYIKIKDRRFWKLHNMKIRNYLIKDFELEGFTKKVGDTTNNQTDILFIKN